MKVELNTNMLTLFYPKKYFSLTILCNQLFQQFAMQIF